MATEFTVEIPAWEQLTPEEREAPDWPIRISFSSTDECLSLLRRPCSPLPIVPELPALFGQVAQVARERRRTLEGMRDALHQGDDAAVLAKARLLVGLSSEEEDDAAR